MHVVIEIIPWLEMYRFGYKGISSFLQQGPLKHVIF